MPTEQQVPDPASVTLARGACLINQEEKSMSVNEIQALAQRFADAFDKNDMKSALEISPRTLR